MLAQAEQTPKQPKNFLLTWSKNQNKDLILAQAEQALKQPKNDLLRVSKGEKLSVQP